MKPLVSIFAVTALGLSLSAHSPLCAQQTVATEPQVVSAPEAPLVLVAPEPSGSSNVGMAAPPRKAGATDSSQGILFPYGLFDAALAGRVDKEGHVDYANLKGDQNLARFIRALETADVSRFPIFPLRPKLDADGKPIEEETPKSRRNKGAEKVAATEDHSWELVFWINAYNAQILKTISDAYPINSVADIKDFDTAKTHVVAGKTYSLAELRDKVASLDRRAIFALTDGTMSGPQLLARSYRWSGISGSLEAAVSAVVNNPRSVKLTRIQNTVAVSDFFQTVDTTFKPGIGRRKWDGIRYLLATYYDQNADRKYFVTGSYSVTFLPRDKTLNRATSIVGN